MDELKSDVMRNISKDMETRFTSNPLYMHSNGQQFPIGAFQDSLKSLFVSRVDSQFLTTFYEDFRKEFVNVASLIRDLKTLQT